MTPELKVKCCKYSAINISADYKTTAADLPILDKFSYEFYGGRIYVLMGPNGCGKSTLLRVLANEKPATSGEASFTCNSGDHPWSVEYIPQDYREAVFPWKTVRENIYPWKNHDRGRAYSNWHGSEHNAKKKLSRLTEQITNVFRRRVSAFDEDSPVNKALAQFGLRAIGNRRSSNLSGGQEQILLLARCTVSSARIVLLDEPFAALDIVRRASIAQHLREDWHGRGRVVISVMHEPDEAVMLADEILVFHGPPLKLAGVVSRATESGPREVSDFREAVMSIIKQVADEGGYDG